MGSEKKKKRKKRDISSYKKQIAIDYRIAESLIFFFQNVAEQLNINNSTLRFQ